jgi:signal transduction histidine kinase/ligand-binding sensor domain-containing protein
VRHLVTPTAGLCAIVAACCVCARALNQDRDIHELAHRSWGEKEGFPGPTQALAQTTDGFLWLGTAKGLFRFDGVRFEQPVPRSGDMLPKIGVESLLALPDGSLWIAYGTYGFANGIYGYGEICLLRNDNVKCYRDTDGVKSVPTALVQDHEGAIWANTETGLLRFNGTQWARIGKDWNFPEDVPTQTSKALFVDSRGILWVGVNRTVLYLKQGSKQFEPTGTFAGYSTSIAEAPDGTIWLADNDSFVRTISTSVSKKSAATARCEVDTPIVTTPNCPSDDSAVIGIWAANDLFFDRNGSLWITTDSYGIVRVPHPKQLRNGRIPQTSDKLQIFNAKAGLSADNCIPVLEDREGTIWVATRDGLDQFRYTALAPVALPTSMIEIAIAPAEDGDIWVAGSYNFVGRIHSATNNVSFASVEAFKPYRDPAGVTWTMGNALRQWKNGRFQRVAQSPAGVAESFGYWQVSGDRSGTLWAFADTHGFFSLDHGRWKAWATPPQVAKQHSANMFSDSTGLIWVSTYEGDVVTMDQGKVAEHPLTPGGPHFIKAFAEHAWHEIWAGGAGGLALIDEGQVRPIRSSGLLDVAGDDVTGIIDAGNDGLWLSTADSVIHVPKSEVDAVLEDPSYAFHGERFDSSDGLPGGAQATDPFPKAIQGTDGRIWFVGAQGVAWINPKQTPMKNAVPPPVYIERIVADRKEYDAYNGLRLPPHVRDLTIDYTALSLVAPEKIRFRYKLEGQDPDWREAVNDREVQYSNLPPRHYTFHVMACNNSGVWNETGAALEFSVLPAFYQTNWFRLLCVTAFLALLWAVYRLRLHQMQGQFALGLEARVGERLRIARELHDTLLQSFQGVAFQLQAARKLILRKADNAEEVLDSAILATEEAIREGRSAIRDLRPEPAAQRNLSELLDAAGRELATAHELNGQAPNYRVLIEGRPQDLSPMLQDEVYRISREVIRNAFAHAAASHIEVEIRYDADHFRLRVRDDGKGIDSKILAAGQAGHFGIPGMRERAQRIGARLDFWSEVGAGTEAELTVPASMAYQKRRDGHRFRLFHGRTEQTKDRNEQLS